MITNLTLFLLSTSVCAHALHAQTDPSDNMQRIDSSKQTIRSQDTLSQVENDSTVGEVTPHSADSNDVSFLFRALVAARDKQNETYQTYYTTPDSIYPRWKWSPFHLFSTDANGLSESLRWHPRFITVPRSLATSLNQALPDGIVAPIYASNGSRALNDYHTDRSTSMDMLSPPEVHSLQWGPGGRLHTNLFPTPLLKPQTLMFWETGVFDENVLAVRFARPLSHQLHMGVFSTFRFFERTVYDHGRGGIYPFYESIYRGLGQDTALIADEGVNPLTDERITSARLRWESMNGWWVMGEYRYSDLRNDLAADLLDTARQQPSWTTRSLYEHRASLYAENLPIGPVHLNTSLRYKSMVERETPRFDAASSRGTVQNGALFLSPSVTLFDTDTLRLRGTAEATSIERFNDQDDDYHTETVALGYIHSFDIGRLDGQLRGEAGGAVFSAGDSTTFKSTWSARADVRTGEHSLVLYGGKNTINPIIPLDTLTDDLSQTPLDAYTHAGAEATLGLGGLSLLGGYQFTDGVSAVSLAKYWPGGQIPYQQPTSTFITGARVGRRYGLALASTWYFSDTRPHVRSHSVLSFQSRLRPRYQQLFIDLAADYWSRRDPAAFGGITGWNETLLDVYLKISVQVKTFRLFWKLDNILNRKLAYVPGYTMPGLTFRWGFNWLLEGF